MSIPSAALFLSRPRRVSRLEPARHDRVISGFPDLDCTYVAKTAAARPEEAVELARFVLDGPASELDVVEDPGEWEEHGFRPSGDPVPSWKVVERDG